MITRILVPTDFSPQADAALGYARGIAREFGSELHLLHVLDNMFLRAMAGDPRDLETAALRQLDERLTAEDRRLGAIATLEKSDEPAKEIVQYAGEAGIDLIVMGTHGRTGLPHVLLGSVAERVIRRARCPVLTIRDGHVAADVTGERHVHSHTRSNGFQRAV